MRLSKYKLIISDLDGTLVPYCTDSVTDYTSRTIRELRQGGIEFTIATGRSWRQCQAVARKLQISGPVIVQSGAMIVDSLDEIILYMQPLRSEIETALSQIGDLPGIDHFYLCESGTYYAKQVITPGGNWLIQYGEPCRLISESDRPKTSSVKQLYIGPEAQLRKISEKIEERVTPKPNLILWPPDQNSDDWFLEVFDPAASKGQALQWLVEHLGISMTDVLAFGDGDNDIDMLKLAGTGVAMAEASPHVIAAADEMIPGPNQEGIARFLSGQKFSP